MRLGLNLGYSGSSLGIDLTMVQEADRLGYHSVWSAEAYGSDAVTPITWVAAHTTRIKVGTAIMQIPARTPTLTATTALTLDQLSGGRFLLGLGVSGPQVVEGWHGVAFGKPLARTREYVEIVRAVWRREKALEFTGTYYQIPYGGADATGLGKPLIVVDFGTATTLDAITAKGEYLGGAICPGVTISADALFQRAARLPRIDVRKPSRVVGRTTVGAMESGLFWGYVGMVEGLVRRMNDELGGDAVCVATGGLADVIAPETALIQHVDPDLTLHGLRIVWERNQ